MRIVVLFNLRNGVDEAAYQAAVSAFGEEQQA